MIKKKFFAVDTRGRKKSGTGYINAYLCIVERKTRALWSISQPWSL